MMAGAECPMQYKYIDSAGSDCNVLQEISHAYNIIIAIFRHHWRVHEVNRKVVCDTIDYIVQLLHMAMCIMNEQ